MCKRVIYLACIGGLGFASMGRADLVGWWKLDEGTGTVVGDSSGNGLNGTLVGSPQWVPGVRGGALLFDGDSRVNLGYPPKTVMPGTLSIACWVNPDKLGPVAKQDRGFVARDGSYVFKVSGNKLRLATPAVTDHDTANATLQTGVWQHAAIEDDNGRRAGIKHPHAGAVNVTSWTEWRIPLSQFAGVNLTKVEKPSIGVGDRNPDGMGRIYVEDIILQ